MHLPSAMRRAPAWPRRWPPSATPAKTALRRPWARTSRRTSSRARCWRPMAAWSAWCRVPWANAGTTW